MKPIPAETLLSFASAALWRRWLAANHATSDGIWLRLHRKGSGKKTVTYAEALESEQKARKLIANFPFVLERAIAYLITLTKRGKYVVSLYLSLLDS